MVPVARRTRRSTSLSNAELAVWFFIAAEITMFSGLIGSQVILRSQYSNWPPLGQPRLPAFTTGVNTLFLLASGVTMDLGVRRLAAGARATRLFRWTGILGTLFLLLQGREWAVLLGYGLNAQGNVYGALFYTIVGTHGLHVLGAVLALWVVTLRARDLAALQAMRLFWLFVVLVWPVLYVLVYL